MVQEEIIGFNIIKKLTYPNKTIKKRTSSKKTTYPLTTNRKL
jgi:hypothetical protein